MTKLKIIQNYTGNINRVTGSLRAENEGIQNRVLLTGIGERAWPMARLEQPGMQKLMPTGWTKDEVYSLEAGEEGTKYLHDQQKS